MTQAGAATSPIAAGPQGSVGAKVWLAVALLTVVGVLNYVDRELPAILAEDMKRELMLSDAQLGFINGLGFLLIYAFLSVPIARLSDRGRYGVVIAASVTFWSLMTALGGACQNMIQLALSRMGCAMGEAGSTPAAHAYISRRFAPTRRGLPLAILSLAAPIGTGLGLLAGGYLTQYLGWREAFVIIGLSGVLLAPIVVMVLGVKADRGEGDEAARKTSTLGAVKLLLANRSYRRLVGASTILALATYSITAFGPAYLMRVHGFSASEVGASFGIAKGLMGAAGLIIGGLIVDRLGAFDPRWMPRLVAVMILIALPASLFAFFASGNVQIVLCMALANAVGTAYLSPTISSVQALIRPELRATASAFLLFVISVVGGIGPMVVGKISDVLLASGVEQPLARALLLVPLMHFLAMFAFWWAGAKFKEDLHVEAAASGAG